MKKLTLKGRDILCGGNCCPEQNFIQDEICGNFNTTVATTPLTVYSTEATVFVGGTVSIYYDRGTTPTITATVTDTAGTAFILTIPRGNTLSQTFNDIDTVTIDSAGAFGKYCLTVHYAT
ncbi:DUF3992 domain-containing protein [Metabacillus malikii]|uniref:Endospore appendages core domain-containing protein n=1 Tax=Metabacillus malikii TaxID=1504265 RepID=A0ABT9ZCV2_9BACI|nr:S-Ena type endospore appendage [Metabacillus malikii]MDQ0229641.1 hypothetical protein [Metabacillus malikii]